MQHKRFIVIGINRFGSAIVRALGEKGKEVTAVDSNVQRLEEVRDLATHAVRLDATNEKALRDIGAHEADAAIVAIGSSDIEANILVTRLLKDLGVPHIIARATSALHEEILYRIGANEVIFLEEEMGKRIAHSVVSPTIHDYIELASDNYHIAEIEIPPSFAGKHLGDVALDFEHLHVQVILISRIIKNEREERKKIAAIPKRNYLFQKGDMLVTLGKEEDTLKFDEYVQEAGKRLEKN
jgi:trk system potassium uptake protein